MNISKTFDLFDLWLIATDSIASSNSSLTETDILRATLLPWSYYGMTRYLSTSEPVGKPSLIEHTWLHVLGDSDESHHNDALAFYGELKEGKHGTLITTDYVIDEASTLLMARKGIDLASTLLDEILPSKKSIHLVWMNEQLFSAAVSTFKASGDNGWSFERYLDSLAPTKTSTSKYTYIHVQYRRNGRL